jgi:AbrB family looped-hinge helix DNA binding protein
MQKAKVTFKGQVTIPKEIRNALNIEEGESVVFIAEGDHAIMKPFKKKSLLDFYGSLPATRPYQGIEAIRKEIRHKLGKRLNKKG